MGGVFSGHFGGRGDQGVKPHKGIVEQTKWAGGKKSKAGFTMDLTVPAVALTKQLAEALRWREIEWARIPALTRKLTMPYLTARDTINLDIAVSDKEERKHLVKAYIGLRSPGMDGYDRYEVNDDGSRGPGLVWVQKRSIDLRNFRLEYQYRAEDQGKVLALLVLKEHQEVATYFVTRCDDVSDAKIEYPGPSTLILASRRGYLEIVQALLGREGTDVNTGDGGGDTALHEAINGGHIEVARALLKAGANARKSNDGDQTPLHLASEEGEIEIVRALLQAGAGADVHKYDEFGANPMIRACEEQHFEVFRALVEAGGDVNKLDSSGFTALHHASGSGLSEGVRYLCLERKADVDKRATDDDGYTPLIFASARGHIEAVRALLEAGADVNKRASDGYETPLSLAFKMNSWRPDQYKQDMTKIAALLREAGAQDLEDYESSIH